MAVPPPQPDPAKADLRKRLRQARSAFVAGGDATILIARHRALAARILPLLDGGRAIAGYVAHRGEPDILPVLLRAHALGHVVALPHVSADRRMHFVRWHPEATLTPGSLGIPQPEPDGEEAVPAIVLTPLVGFDRRGHRLGQGGGYYDRWFAAHPEAMRIGIAWSAQEAAALPCDAWDIRLHAVATEKEWIAL